MTQQGKFIVFEGIDGSGKSTISSMLYARLHQEYGNIYKTAEPTTGPIGSTLRNILTKRIEADEKTIAALFLADRLDHLQNPVNGMLKFLSEGIHVISDRYYYSSYAYHVPYLPMDWVISANKACADILRPDIVFFLDISVEESLKRINANRKSTDLYETEHRLTEVRKNYQEAIRREGKKDNVVIINAERSIEEIFADIWSRSIALLAS